MITLDQIKASPAYIGSFKSAMYEVGNFWAKHGHMRIYFEADKLNKLAETSLDTSSKHYYNLLTDKFHIDGDDEDLEQIKEALDHRARVLFVNDPYIKETAEELGTTVEELREVLDVSLYILKLNYEPKYHKTPSGEVFLQNGKVFLKISSKFVPDNHDEYDRLDGGIPLVSEHHLIEAIDVTDTPEGQEHLKEAKAKQLRAKYIAEIKKNIREAGTPIERVNGYLIPQPAGEVLSDSFDNYGSGERLIETPTEYWYLINNGGDGDDWSRNTVSTGGAGAYGWRLAK